MYIFRPNCLLSDKWTEIETAVDHKLLTYKYRLTSNFFPNQPTTEETI